MRVRVKAARNYATIVKMREFRLRGCNHPRSVASAAESTPSRLCTQILERS